MIIKICKHPQMATVWNTLTSKEPSPWKTLGIGIHKLNKLEKTNKTFFIIVWNWKIYTDKYLVYLDISLYTCTHTLWL